MLGYITDIYAIQGNTAFCNIIKPRNQIYQRGLAASRASDDRSCLTRLRCEINIVEHIFACPRITERYVVELQNALRFFRQFHCFLRIMYHGCACEHFIYTVRRNGRPWQHDGNHAQHQEAGNDLHCILNKRHHIPDLHLSVINTVSAAPDNQNGDAVHNQHHSRHHKCHGTVYKKGRSRQIPVCLVKTLFLVLFRRKCTDNG